jgi:CheY-like chemotaxis protein
MERKRILVADDHALTRETVAKMLRDEGYDVVLATDGQEALALLSTYHPDLVLTDLSMPRLSGIDVLTSVKRLAPTTPVIIFTADARPEVEREARQRGAQDYLHKPFDFDDLLQRIAYALIAGRAQ